MADATYLRDECDYRLVAAAAVASGEVWQLPNGRAAVKTGLAAAAANDAVNFTDEGHHTMTKTSGFVALPGMPAYWDHSANAITYKAVNDKDFFVGTFTESAASTDTTCVVNLNVQPRWTIDALKDGALSVATGTSAAGGFGLPRNYGGAAGLVLTATNEAQCVDLLSVDRRAIAANGIVQAVVRLGANGSTSDVDFNIGVANGTSTTDADAITEHVLFHVDGGALDVFAQSKDGTTTVTATDTTANITAGSAVSNRMEFWIDMRDPADIQLYVDGANVLPSSVFKLDAGTGPIGLLAHLEKTSGTATAGPVYIDALRMLTAEQ